MTRLLSIATLCSTLAGCGASTTIASRRSTRADDAAMALMDTACRDPAVAIELVLPDDERRRITGSAAHYSAQDDSRSVLVDKICEDLVKPGAPDSHLVGAEVVGRATIEDGLRDGVDAVRVNYVLQVNDSNERWKFTHNLIWVATASGYRLAWIE